MSFLEIILSSAVIVALIEFISKNKSNSLEYITSARNGWRKEIKKTACRLDQASPKDIGRVFAELKVNLNGYGFYPSLDQYPDDKYLDFFKDEHIWKQMDYIEEKADEWDEAVFNQEKNKMAKYITCLLKFDWERSKQEVKSKSMLLGFTVLYVGIHIAFFYILGNGRDIIHQISTYQIPAVCIVFAFITVCLPYVMDEFVILRFGKWYKRLSLYIICWIAAVFIQLYSFYMMNVISSGRLNINYYYVFGLLSSFILICLMFYTFSFKFLYLHYDRAVRRIMNCDSVVCYSNQTGVFSDLRGLILNDFFAQLNVDFSEKMMPTQIDEMMDTLCNSDHPAVKDPTHLLRIGSRIRFLFCRNRGNIYEFIKEKPKRCKLLIEYKTGPDKDYAVGCNLDTWHKLKKWVYQTGGSGGQL